MQALFEYYDLYAIKANQLGNGLASFVELKTLLVPSVVKTLQRVKGHFETWIQSQIRDFPRPIRGQKRIWSEQVTAWFSGRRNTS